MSVSCLKKSHLGWNGSKAASGLLETQAGRTTAAIFIFQCAVVGVVSSMALELEQPRFFKC